MSEALLAVFHQERHRLVTGMASGTTEDMMLRKGKVQGVDLLLGALEQLEAEILGKPKEPPEEDEE